MGSLTVTSLRGADTFLALVAGEKRAEKSIRSPHARLSQASVSFPDKPNLLITYCKPV